MTARQPAAELERMEETAQFRYLSSEAAKAYGGLLARFRREVLFVRSKYFVVADDVAGAKGKLEWHFHSTIEPEKTRTGFLLRGKRGSATIEVPPDCTARVDDLSNPHLTPHYRLALARKGTSGTLEVRVTLAVN